MQVVPDGDPMHRRLLLTLTGAVLIAPVHRALLTRTMDTRIEIETVDEIDTTTASLRRMND